MKQIEKLMRPRYPVVFRFSSYGDFIDAVLFLNQFDIDKDNVMCGIRSGEIAFIGTDNPYATESEYKGRGEL